jgi:Tfp pilus assembly protein PilX
MAAQAQQVVSQRPQYVIEALCTPDSTTSIGGIGCPKYYYRITSRGFGGSANTQVTLQMIVRQ